MDLLMLRYVVLHSFQLWSDHTPPLPVVVPMVFYTEGRQWDVSLETGELYAAVPPECRPLLRYEVVDMCGLAVPEGSENIITLLAEVVRGAISPWRSRTSAGCGRSASRSGLRRNGRIAQAWRKW